MPLLRRSLLALAAIAAAITALVGCAADPLASASARQALAPTGSLRVGVYVGSPSSVLVGDAPGQERGVGYDLGRALAARLGVPFKPVIFPNNAEVLAAIKAGSLDVIFTNMTSARARDMDFSSPFLDVEKSFLVGPASPLDSIAAVRRPGLRVGVSEGSSTQGELAPELPGATIVPAASLKVAIEMLRDGRIDAFATNNAILYEMSDALPGSRVLPGRWGMEHFAAAIPKGRAPQLPALDAFITDAMADGTVARAVARAGLRGTVAPVKR
jgi:polar amino acid transport system substrate-binding protein